MPTRAEAKVTTDHDEIRQWAEERGARPTCVRNTGDEGDIGILRLDFPGYSGAGSLEEISWEDFFEKFDERGLALLHQEMTARGQKSNFNKLISRETAEGQRSRESSRSESRTKARGRSRAASASRGEERKTKKSASRRDRAPASSRKRKSTGKTTAKPAATRSRSASAKRSSSTRSRSTGTRRAAARGTRATSPRAKAGAKRTATKSAARKSASAGRTQSNRGRTNTRKRSNPRRTAPARRSISNASQSRGGRSSAGSRILTNHDEIRQWAEERSAHPACVRGTGRKKDDTGMIRLDFPGYSGARSLQEIDWDDWFRQFDDNNLALVVQDSTARGQRSNFNKLVGRETAQAREHGGHASRRHPERRRKTGSTQISGSRAQVKSTRGSNRGSRTASARGQHRDQERRAA